MRELIEAILKRLDSLTYFRNKFVWNNHVDRARAGFLKYNTPAIYLEIQNKKTLNLGGKLNGIDLSIRFHIVLMELDDMIGSYDYNFQIMNIRDDVNKLINSWTPVNCSAFSLDGDGLDFKHDNIYHHVMKFKTHWIDNAAYDYLMELDQHYVIWDEDFGWDNVSVNWDNFEIPNLEVQIN